MMLARHAEDLYWAGRYLERAQDTARVLDVIYHASVTSPVLGDDRRWHQTLDVLLLAQRYGECHDTVDGRRVMDLCILDRGTPSSLIALVDNVRENIRKVRELLSSELWEVVNDSWLALHARDLVRETEQHPAGLLGWVRTQSHAIVGVAVETMPRDETSAFLFLGAQLERAMITCRLLRSMGLPFLESATTTVGDWLLLLRCCAGAEAYLRSGGGSRTPTEVLRFLAFDPAFPRSLRHTIGECTAHVRRLTGSPDDSRAARLLGRLQAKLQFADLDEWVADGLPRTLDDLHQELSAVNAAIGARFFRQGDPDELQSQIVPAGGRFS